MSNFANQKDLIAFAEAFLDERKSSLIRDTENCLNGIAPFPALLYCFSVIDLMGALLCGDANDKPTKGTVNMATEYMKNFMSYTDDQIKMLQKVFRHKIVHLSQPLFVRKDGAHKIAWHHDHDNKKEHLKIETGLTEQDIGVLDGIPTNLLINPVRYNATFTVSIMSLAEDICKSIDSYIVALKKDATLQQNFDKAIEVITGV